MSCFEKTLERAYKTIAQDLQAERDALIWCEAVIQDIADATESSASPEEER